MINVYVLIPRTCEYITLHSKREFADIIRDYLSRPNVIQGSYKREKRMLETEDVKMEAERRCNAAGFEDGRRGLEPRSTGDL